MYSNLAIAKISSDHGMLTQLFDEFRKVRGGDSPLSDWFIDNYLTVEMRAGKIPERSAKEIQKRMRWVKDSIKQKDCIGSLYYHQGQVQGLFVMAKELLPWLEEKVKDDGMFGEITFD